MDELKINTDEVRKTLVDFIRDEFQKAGFTRAVLGISGGLDSALCAYTCCEALGRDNTIGFILPYEKQILDVRFATLVADTLKIRHELIDISPMVDIYFKRFSAADRIRRGNKMARERMSILYDQSKVFNALVIGTGNKTEILLGYFTIFGDSACAVNPIAGLYKTQTFQLAEAMGVPKEILERKPSAGLWPGQTDEGDFGYKYADIDRLLFYMVDKKRGAQELLALGFKKKFIEDIAARIEKNKFKTEPPRTIQT